jgi:16S rRNA (guanine966-N2)-methyltransferase
MTRIIAGQAKGRRLLVPAKGTRPTSDRVRESLFNTLTSELLAENQPWSTLSVLDLYAGSGALGIEAASRGAQPVVLVEKARLAAEIIRKNIDLVGLPGLQLLSTGVADLLGRTPSVAFTLVFADPPYDVSAGSLRELLNSLVETGWVAPLARVVVERPTSDPEAPLPDFWIDFSQRRYGDTTLWYGRATNTTGE